ncbi:MAG TPA: hypothetical protein VKT72_13800 [Candidatus Baltobacteraceae bacterium]|nr:hypothetical protein [Candidatus Baltobacteraceae bacterium]
MPTAAQARLSEEQKRYPPPSDRVSNLYAALQAYVPAEVQKLAAQGDLVAGEIGEIHPDVATAYLKAGGYSIEFTTGMMLYTELIARYCAGLFVEGAVGATPITVDEVNALLEAVMQTYKQQSRAIWKIFRPKFAPQDVPISPAAAQFRDGILDSMRIFMLAHELGHVAISANICKPESDNEEVAADALGLQFALPATAEKHSWRIALAGAAAAIRIFVSLQRFGVRFSSAYPPQDQRLASLEARTRAMLGCEQRADEAGTVMVAILDMMDDLDSRIQPGEATWHYTEQRARIGLLARLIEVANGNISPDDFVEMLGPYQADLQPDVMARILKTLHEYYYDWADTQGYYMTPTFVAQQSLFSHKKLIALSLALRAIVPKLPLTPT